MKSPLVCRARRRPVRKTRAHTPIIRQWQILERLVSEPDGVTVTEASAAAGVDKKTIRRDLVLLREAGFDVVEVTVERGLKRWRVRHPFERLRSKKRQYRAIREGLDVLLWQAKTVGDTRLTKDLEAARRRVARKCSI